MRVLVGCESSGVVRDAFRRRGVEAWSNDLESESAEGEFPEYHLVGDALYHVQYSGPWDLLIAHPPCTYLCSSGLHWNHRVPGRDALTEEALVFVRALLESDVPHIALENPRGRIGTAIRKADQTINPYQFGHDASKATCLWLKGLPKLRLGEYVEPKYGCRPCRSKHDLSLLGIMVVCHVVELTQVSRSLCGVTKQHQVRTTCRRVPTGGKNAAEPTKV